MDEKILIPKQFSIKCVGLFFFKRNIQMIWRLMFYNFATFETHPTLLRGEKPLVFENKTPFAEGQRSVSKAGPPKRCSAGPWGRCVFCCCI